MSRSSFLRWLVPLAIAIVAALLLRSQIAFFSVPSSSMEPALLPGETIVVVPHRNAYPDRGDIIVFRLSQNEKAYFVKRVIALPGDLVEIAGGEVRVNGSVLDEPYVSWRDGSSLAAQIIPSETVFVLGDRRQDSVDSRVWGAVPAANVVGRVSRIFWSNGNRDDGGRSHSIRFDRIGTKVR